MSHISSVIAPTDHLDAGRAALGRGDWPAARLAFEAWLRVEENPEALEGLGLAAWWLDLADVVFDARERAYRIYRERDDSLGAARMAVWLAWDTAAFRGEQAIANGWLQRPIGFSTAVPTRTEHAWLALRSGRLRAARRRRSGSGGSVRRPRRCGLARRSARWTTRWSAARCTALRA